MLIAFRSRLTADAGADYTEMSDNIEAHARSFPGFVDVKSFTAADGERLTLVWWADADTLRAWATDARHVVAKRTGRAQWYEYYRMEVRRSFAPATSIAPARPRQRESHEHAAHRHPGAQRGRRRALLPGNGA